MKKKSKIAAVGVQKHYIRQEQEAQKTGIFSAKAWRQSAISSTRAKNPWKFQIRPWIPHFPKEIRNTPKVGKIPTLGSTGLQ